jgi:hypothetical protein
MQSKTQFGETPKPAPQTYPIVETPNGLMVKAFNLYWPPQNDIALHLNAYRLDIKKEHGGLGKVRHLVEAYTIIWPEKARSLHEWTVRRFKTFCAGHKVITLAGGAGTSKSHDAAMYALLWWWALPMERTVLVASTTIGALQKRIWSYLTEGLRSAVGNMPGIPKTHPTPMILFDRGDVKHGIHGIALREGEAERTLREVIGIHPKEGLLVIIDEATDVTPAITDAITNWDKGGVNFQMIAIGNSKSKLDPHGRLSRPTKGWNAINPDIDEEWSTQLGVCLFFDCYKSPAIHAPYKDRLPFLITKEEIEKEEKRLGKSDPKFWRFVRGFWPPDDLTRTVLTLTMVEKHNASKMAKWEGSWKIWLAALDPAFTSEGDECILRFASMGPFQNGVIGVDFGGEENILSLSLDAKSGEPITYQIVRQAREECKIRGIEAHCFGADTWGFGMGAGDLFEREWSPDIHRVISAGAPSDRFIDSEMGDKANEVYDRRITELWFAMRTFVQSGQVRGLDEISIEEFCSREYVWKGRKMALETKVEYKKRMGRDESPTGSPDRGDAAALILEVARLNGLTANERQINLEEEHDWERKWENEMGHKGQKEEDREQMWSADGILDSVSFDEKWEE